MSLKLLSQKFYSILNLSASISFQLQTAQLVNHIMKFLIWIFGFGVGYQEDILVFILGISRNAERHIQNFTEFGYAFPS